MVDMVEEIVYYLFIVIVECELLAQHSALHGRVDVLLGSAGGGRLDGLAEEEL